jgi:hypothetical protein
MQVCERMGWSLDYYHALEPDEQMTWIAWELDRVKGRDELIHQIMQGKPYTEQVTTRALLALLRNG